MRSKKEASGKINILITGDDNYNNVDKFNRTLQHVYDVFPEEKVINTFGSVYGAQLLARLYAENENTKYYAYSTDMLKTNKFNSSQKYYILFNIAIKKMDLVIIFSSVVTKKVQLIVKKCISEGVEYLIIKE